MRDLKSYKLKCLLIKILYEDKIKPSVIPSLVLKLSSSETNTPL